jgi:membrane protein implicated in regulation of membrane protease activity
MIEETVRPLSRSERQKLTFDHRLYSEMRDRYASPTPTPSNAVGAALIVPALLPAVIWTPAGWIAAAGLTCAAIWTIVHFRRQNARLSSDRTERAGRRAEALRAALDDGHVVVRRVSSTRVVQADRGQGEGHTVEFFDLGDDRSMCVHAEDLAPDEESDTWPCSEFELVTTRSGAVALGVVQRGDAVREVREFDRTRATDAEFPATGTIVPGGFDSLESKLGGSDRRPGI